MNFEQFQALNSLISAFGANGLRTQETYKVAPAMLEIRPAPPMGEFSQSEIESIRSIAEPRGFTYVATEPDRSVTMYRLPKIG